MARLRSIDDFIERSNRLLEARPITTRVSVTYSHRTSKREKRAAEKGDKDDGENNTVNPNATSAALYVKTYDPVSGTCFKIRVSKSNELSRVWSALGPKSLEVTKKERTSIERGMAAIMADKEFALSTDNTPQQTAVASPVQAPVEEKRASKKKNKKR